MVNDQLDSWRYLSSSEAAGLLEAAAAAGEQPTPASIDRMRLEFPDAPIAEALELVMARRRAQRKFPDASALICDRQGVEQATSRRVADWKAERFGDLPVLDLCSGIGGDAMSLARRGETVGVDHSEVRALMCEHNAGISVRTEDVTTTAIDKPLVHIDPARRDEATRRRSWRLQDLQPSLEEIASITTRCDGAAIKLGPGLPRDVKLPDPDATIEFIAEKGSLVQAVAWCGGLRTTGALRRASDVVLELSVEGDPAPPPYRDSVGQRLLVPHPALERAELISKALEDPHAGELAPGLGILSTDLAVESPWFEEFEVLDVLPPREAKVRRWLEDRNAGGVVVRTRDHAIDAEKWTRRVQGRGEIEFVLFGLRLVQKVVVCATRRVLQRGSSAP